MIDRYIAGVLTIIAGALVVLVLQNVVRPSVGAVQDVQKVQICDESHCVSLRPIAEFPTGGGPTTYWGLPVAPEEKMR
jgi:hypothetical protein